MSSYSDTYFFNSKLAKIKAKECNKLDDNISKVQICYHGGKLTHKNLIGIPIESFKMYFQNNSFRRPTYIDFSNSKYENDEESQLQIVKIFATIFEEIDNDDMKIVSKYIEKFNKLRITKSIENTKIAFISTKKKLNTHEFFKQMVESLNSNYSYKFISEKSQANMILDDVSSKDVFNVMLSYQPNIIMHYNEFYPQLFHKDIIHIHFIDSFAICNKILEYEEKINMKNNLFFSSSSYYDKLLSQKGIKTKTLPPVVNDIPKKPNSFNKRKIDLLICENYFSLKEYIVFDKMIQTVNKFLNNKNKLTINKLANYIKATTYPNTNDWELNIFIHKHIVLQYILKNITTDIKMKIIGKNWTSINNKNYTVSNKYKVSMYQNTKYVFVIFSTIINEELLNILTQGAIPIVYDLRDDDKYYDKTLNDYCLFIDTVDDVDNIIKENIKPNKFFDKNLKSKYSMKNLLKSLTKALL